MTNSYFDRLDSILRDAGQARPCLIVDRDRLDHNISLARSRARLPVRVVAKSLACLPLLDRACEGLGAIGLMTFSATMLETLLAEKPTYSHLMGKPLPTPAVSQVLASHPSASDQVTWLVDTPERAKQLSVLAEQHDCTLRIALELDVGLHRGGVIPTEMSQQIATLNEHKNLRFVGVMGYEPHLTKLPFPFHNAAQTTVNNALMAAKGLELVNTAGSMTFSRYGPEHGATEISLGSVLLKPSDFDLADTKGFEPALFIAAPILKYLPGNPMPGPAWLSRLIGRGRRADLAIYGGYWKGQPVHPPGYKYSGVFGHSSNQEVWSGPHLSASPVDLFAFVRPSQSEAILPEFGEILVISEDRVIDHWPCLSVAQ